MLHNEKLQTEAFYFSRAAISPAVPTAQLPVQCVPAVGVTSEDRSKRICHKNTHVGMMSGVVSMRALLQTYHLRIYGI